MKKNLLYTVVVFLFIFSFTIKVDAYCTSKRYSDLKAIAYKSEVNYELKFDEKHNHYFEVTLTNVDKDILVSYNGVMLEPVNGTVELENRFADGVTYDIKLYGGYYTHCVEEYLYTKKITLPKYNTYSERDECIEYEEFPLCGKWYKGNIVNEDDFLKQLNDYILSLQENEEEKKPIKSKDLFEKITNFYVNNIVFTLPITIILLLFVVYKIVVRIIRRKNRIKLND